MKKDKLLPCPFCGNVPKSMKFCSTAGGPALMCDYCGADGPPAFKTEISGGNEDRFTPRAIKAWNKRMIDSASYRRGIEAAASFVEMFDKYVTGHPYMLSDCILAKFNVLEKRRKVRKNPDYVSKERRGRQQSEGVVRRRS